ncbi:response regulator [Syntrophorhabdus aromaticivorans]|jgi:DNA-binding NarL/FixJ family response regulator|uniref:Response regulator transcription factor n=1 Tax=Syntrophorhabdus aromaticivorans TaxID=328301 RepID=A0A351U064_9BACT|nr:response regulator transcription factor [Syntrophorhabdus aromaticivorans]NLW34029.1 response regulator transcription factor [Syntrophorhabdus aromaticivorans]HBA53345.1 DNA-binding response regulator [Syntrophorhabdus aromaticivorans]
MTKKKEADSTQRKHKIFIVDDHPIVRKGLSQLINQEADLVVCGEAADAHGALERLKKLKPDLVIVDISLKGIDGIELIRQMKVRYGNLPALVVSMHDESLFAERALRVGARGYIMKQEAIEIMMEAIRKVLRGEIYISEKVSATIVKKFIDGKSDSTSSPEELLSDRELEVFQLIGQGIGTRAIAEQLHLSVKTVEAYRANIKEKLNLKNATELLKHAMYWIESR